MAEAFAVPHPREVFDLVGHEVPEESFESARARGRLHHAWLLTGHEGVGKATFAYRAARRLLGAPADPRHGVLGADPFHPVCRQIIARSHPDLLVLERIGEDGKVRKVIPVDEARTLGEFFSKSPAVAPHRVGIIAAADDLNVNAANAVLKTLEEPPPRGVLFLISDSPGRLLPSILSRFRRLAFEPLPEAFVAEFVRDDRHCRLRRHGCHILRHAYCVRRWVVMIGALAGRAFQANPLQPGVANQVFGHLNAS
jgi:DNA polymerase-3 subunit delta'